MADSITAHTKHARAASVSAFGQHHLSHIHCDLAIPAHAVYALKSLGSACETASVLAGAGKFFLVRTEGRKERAHEFTR